MSALPSGGACTAAGGIAAPAFAVLAFAAGKRAEFQRRYAEDLARLQAQLPATARWVDSHCHLESILQRSWRRGGKPQVLESENLVSLEELVALWPPGEFARHPKCVAIGECGR